MRSDQPSTANAGNTARALPDIESWLVAKIAETAMVEPSEIDVRDSLESFGLSSREAVTLSAELSDWLGRDLSPTLAWEHPSIQGLARYLSGEVGAGSDAGGAAAESPSTSEPIAIIGIGCRFPGADGPDAFWHLLSQGVDAISEIPPDRTRLASAYDEDPSVPGKMNTRWGGFLPQIDQFAPAFFGISPREAARMDPQQRLLLEVSWEALEDAGLVSERLAGTPTGVFVGISTNDYGALQIVDPSLIDPYTGTGNALSIAANRISYLFDFAGPSLALDTACSSSLVAVHLACESLRRGESSLALAGGANLILDPGITVNFSKAGLMAPDGRCKTFDARADGYVRGEGAGMVVLKRLSQAVADDDPIYAVILGSAVNQDGRTNGLMAPNPKRQEDVLRAAYARANVSPSQVQYVEAHGTGTLLGDQIEASALGNVLRLNRAPEVPCIVGSLKTNIGHLEAAAGVAGLIKVALALKHRAIPPSLHFERPNPHIPFDDLALRVPTSLAPWPGVSEPPLAGISSFGFGGTNVHAVLTAAPAGNQKQVERPAGRHYLLPLSARSPEELRLLAGAYAAFLAPNGPAAQVNLGEIAASAGLRRSHHDYRLAIVGSTHAELRDGLSAYLRHEPRRTVAAHRALPARRHKLAFVFSGHGSQWAGMGRDLLASEPVFRQAIEECDLALRPHVEWSLLAELQASEQDSRLDRADIAQPAIFAIQVALAALWRSWGIQPDAVVGHSLGEVAASCVSGALSLDDAARVVVHRSRALQRVSGPGRTALIGLSPEALQPWLAGHAERVSIAARNSPASTLISGDAGAVDQIVDAVSAQAIFGRLVNMDVAVHSAHLDPVLDEFGEAVADIRPRLPSVPIFSSVTGVPSQGRQFNGDYWVRNLREPVLFADTIAGMLEKGFDVFLELGPHPVLPHATRECLEHHGCSGHVLPSMHRREHERATPLGSLGTLYTLGMPIAWTSLFPEPGVPIRLPTYRWARERFWFEPETDSRAARDGRAAGSDPAARSDKQPPRPCRLATAHPCRLATAHPVWEITLGRADLDWLGETRSGEEPVSSSAALVALALTSSGDRASVTLRELEFLAPFTLASGERTIQIIQTPEPGGPTRLQIYSSPAGDDAGPDGWTQHAVGWLERVSEPRQPVSIDVAALESRCGQDVPVEALEFGSPVTTPAPLLRVVKLARGADEAIATVHMLAAREDDGGAAFRLDLRVLGLAWSLLAVASEGKVPDSAARLAPRAIDRISRYGPLPEHFVAHARTKSAASAPSHTVSGDVRFFDAAGTIIAEMSGLWLEPAHETSRTPEDELSRETLLSIPAEERQQAVITHFRAELARVLGIAESRIDDDQPLDTMGLDSLMAIQLQSRIEQGFGLRLSPMDLLLGPTLRELAAIVLERLPMIDNPRAGQLSDHPVRATGDPTLVPEIEHASASPALEEELARLGQLSDEELDSLLNAMLAEEGNSK